jgi:hypothetical protein
MPLSGDFVIASDTVERVGSVLVTTSSATFTTTELTLITGTFPVTAGKSYKISGYVFISSTVVGDTVSVKVRQSTALGFQMQLNNVYIPTTGGAGWVASPQVEYTASTTGTESFFITAVRLAGTGTCQMQSGVNRPCALIVDAVQ